MRNAEYKLLDFDNGTQRFFNLTTDPLESKNLLETTVSAAATTNYNLLCQEIASFVGKSGCKPAVAITATEDLFNDEMPQVFPNSFKDCIRIKNTNGKENYQLVNVLGQIIYSGNAIQNKYFGHLPSGIYVLEIEDKGTSKHNLVKE